MNDDIDAIWATLQEQESKTVSEYQKRVKDIKSHRNVAGDDFDLSRFLSKENTTKKKKKESTKTTSKSTSSGKHKNQEESKSNEQEASDSVTNEDKPTREKIDQERALALLNRDIANCSHEEGTIRRKALINIHDVICNQYEIADEDCNAILHEVAKVVCRAFADNLEKCRELAAKIMLGLFEKATDFLPILGYYFPALIQRLPPNLGYDEELQLFFFDRETHEAFKRGKAVDRQDKADSLAPSTVMVIESSEEIRLLVLRSLRTLVSRIVSMEASSILQAYFHEAVIFSEFHTRDPYPDVKIEACIILETMAKQPDFELGMKFFATALVRVLLPLLRHRHAKVRVAAVNSVHACLCVPDRAKCRAAGSAAIPDLVGFREENVIQVAAFYKADVLVNYLAEIVVDPSIQVRERVAEFLTTLLTEIGDRFDHQTRILPYLLDLLADDSDSVSSIAIQCLKKCGKQYEEEHPDDIIEKRQYGVDGDLRINLDKSLPKPFVERPRIGMRLYVRGASKRFVFALVNELTNWVSQTRIKSAKLLKLVIVLCEEHLTMEAHSLFPSYIKALVFSKDDGDKELHTLLLEVFELVGRYTLPEVYLHYILPRLRGDADVVAFGVDTNTRIVVMELLAALIDGSKASQIAPFFEEIVSCLSDPSIIDPESEALQVAVIEVLTTLLSSLKGRGKASAAIESHFLATGRLKTLKIGMKSCFRVLLLNLTIEKNRIKASNAMAMLASLDESYMVHGVADLFDRLGNDILDEIMSSYDDFEDTWSIKSPEHRTFAVLIDNPYFNVFESKVVFERVINFVCRVIRQVENNASMLVEFGRILEVLIRSISQKKVESQSFDTFESLGFSMPWKGLCCANNNRALQAIVTLNQNWSNIVEVVLSNTCKWNKNVDSMEQQIRLISLILSRNGGNDSGNGNDNDNDDSDSDIAKDTNDIRLPFDCMDITQFLDIVKAFVPIVRSTTHPSLPWKLRCAAVHCSGQLLHIAANLCGFDRVRSFNHWMSNGSDVEVQEMRENCIVGVQPLLNHLITMMDDGHDSVRIAVVREMLNNRMVTLIARDDCNDDHRVSFTPFTRTCMKEAISIVHNGRDNDMFAVLDYILRNVAVLDPIMFEEVLRKIMMEMEEQIDANGNANDKAEHKQKNRPTYELISELIDHASLLSSLNSSSK